ncbi:MAG: histidine phosphatase family protein [Alicyclobacillus sp.]|nr:histidine phosphatase family protein [Alicyclobacillus sp.]
MLAGMGRIEAIQRYPVPPGGWPLHLAVQGGEPEIVFFARVVAAVSEILTLSQPAERLAIVSHGRTIS